MIPMPVVDSNGKGILFNEENASYIEFIRRYEEIPVKLIEFSQYY